ncbi:MAG: SIR2 family protein [Fusobacteriaceae bacterium]
MKNLKKAYSEGKLIPFLGSGLSIPFGALNWIELAKKMVNEHISDVTIKNYHLENTIIKKNNCIKAFDEIIEEKYLREEMLNSKIKELLEESIDKNLNENQHNYEDLAKLMCNCYLTTNYDSLGYDSLKKIASNEVEIPQVFEKLKSNTQNFISQGKIKYFFLHGMLADESTLITTTKSYTRIYKQSKDYDSRLNTLFSSNVLLFVGFSFNDIYIQEYLKKYLNINKGIHYILLPKSLNGREKKLIDYGLITIFYDDSNGHVNGIRKLLLEIKESKKKNLTVENYGEPKTLNEVKDNVFIEKLKIEKIKDRKIEMCIDLFIDAEYHIRNLEKSGIPKEIVDCLFSKVFDEYSKVFSDFEEDSTKLLNDIHDKLEKIKYDLENNKIERKIREEELAPSQRVHKGIIHYLANEKKSERKRVVWGENWRDEE